MNNTLYVGLSRQMTLKRELDVIANNIANSDTAGFKVESMMQRQDVETPQLKAGAAPADPIVFVADGGLARDYAQGLLKQTGGTFDLGLKGDGFFQVQTANGNRLTRDGRFSLDAQGQLVDAAGEAVLSSGGQPIRLDPTKSAPLIAKDGTISQGADIVGKVGVFKVADRTLLGKIGANLYDPGGQTPVADTSTVVEQGMVENSNVDAIQQMTRMIAVSRAYEQVSNMMDQTGSTTDESIQRLGKVN